jgi:hypothetical protein
MRDLEPQEVLAFVNSSLDALRGDWSSFIERDRDGLPVSLCFEGPHGPGPEVPLRLTQRTIQIGRDVVALSAPNAGSRILAALALELVSALAPGRPPLVTPRTGGVG